MFDSERYYKKLLSIKLVLSCYRLSVWFYEQYFVRYKILPLNSKSFIQYAGQQADWQQLQPLSAVTRLITDEMQSVFGKIHDQIKAIEHISPDNRICTGRCEQCKSSRQLSGVCKIIFITDAEVIHKHFDA